MNISGIPQLQAAAGFSIGEVVVLAKGHRSRTLQEALAFSLLATAELNWHSAHNRKSTLKQAFRTLAGRDIVEPDTSKQPQACVHERKRHKEKETSLQWKALLFTGCWHFLFREAAGYLGKTGLKEDFLCSL